MQEFLGYLSQSGAWLETGRGIWVCTEARVWKLRSRRLRGTPNRSNLKPVSRWTESPARDVTAEVRRCQARATP